MKVLPGMRVLLSLGLPLHEVSSSSSRRNHMTSPPLSSGMLSSPHASLPGSSASGHTLAKQPTAGMLLPASEKRHLASARIDSFLGTEPTVCTSPSLVTTAPPCVSLMMLMRVHLAPATRSLRLKVLSSMAVLRRMLDWDSNLFMCARFSMLCWCDSRVENVSTTCTHPIRALYDMYRVELSWLQHTRPHSLPLARTDSTSVALTPQFWRYSRCAGCTALVVDVESDTLCGPGAGSGAEMRGEGWRDESTMMRALLSMKSSLARCGMSVAGKCRCRYERVSCLETASATTSPWLSSWKA
mmetsp:Transcript_67328/g.166270  ORF Transcript_67328/g.166270 Transcript_67328/m.166270 type:complete len:299 (+) Transcript_67328:4393-5289(+)